MDNEDCFVPSCIPATLADRLLPNHNPSSWDSYLALQRVSPGMVFEGVGTGPVYLKLGHIKKPIIVKAYV